LVNPAAARLATPTAKTAYDALLEEYEQNAGTTAGMDPAGSVAGWREQLRQVRGIMQGEIDPTTAMLDATPMDQPLPVDEAQPSPVRLYNQATVDMITRRARQTDKLLLNEEARLGAFGER